MKEIGLFDSIVVRSDVYHRDNEVFWATMFEDESVVKIGALGPASNI